MVLRSSLPPSVARTTGRRPEASASARASAVLPVPDSPVMRMGASDTRHDSTSRRSAASEGYASSRSSGVRTPGGMARARSARSASLADSSRWPRPTTADSRVAATPRNSLSRGETSLAGSRKSTYSTPWWALSAVASMASRRASSGTANAARMPKAWKLSVGPTWSSTEAVTAAPSSRACCTRVRLTSCRSRADSARPSPRALTGTVCPSA